MTQNQSVNSKGASWRTRLRSWRPSAGKVLSYAVQRAAEKRLPQVAASLTYTTVLALVPFLAVVLALFTAFPIFNEFKLALENFMTTSLMPAAVSQTVMEYLNQFAAKAAGLTTIGAVFLMVTSIMLIMTIDGAFNDIWNVERQRPLKQRMLVYWAIITLGPILAGASLWMTSFLAQVSLQRLQTIPAALDFLLALIPFVITSLGFAALFMYVPNRQVYWRDALAGGVGTALVLTIMKTGFAFYISRFPSYTVIYGAFATLPIFLLWIYLSWLGILLGATVAATLPSLRLRRWAEKRQPGAGFVDAIQVLRILHRAQGTPEPGRSIRFLSDHLQLHPDELLAVLQRLHVLGYVVPSQTRGIDQWVMVGDPSQVEVGRLVDLFLIDRTQLGLVQEPGLLKAVSAVLDRSPHLTLAQVLQASGTTEAPAPVRKSANEAK